MAMAIIRQVTREDIAAITEIYNHYILHSTATFEMEAISETDMWERVLSISPSYPYLVCEADGITAGYAYAHPWRERAAYRHTLETTIYLSPHLTGRGFGRLLMQYLISECRSAGYKALIACITGENETSRTFHRRLGFKQASHFKGVGRKFGRWLDVTDYELLL